MGSGSETGKPHMVFSQLRGGVMAYVTIRDVARRAGISVSTVSRALNGNGRISAETKHAVEKAMEELHYIPDSRARAMRSSSTKTVGLLVPDIRNGYFADLAYAI